MFVCYREKIKVNKQTPVTSPYSPRPNARLNGLAGRAFTIHNSLFTIRLFQDRLF
jgi:hypothetical protein